MKYIRALFAFLVLFPFVAYAQQTSVLIHNIPTNASVPLTNGSCLLVDQFIGGVSYIDAKVCSNWAATFGALSIANNLSDIQNPNQAYTNLGGGALGKLPMPAQSALLGSSGTGFTNIALGANLSLTNNILSASSGSGGTPGGNPGQIQYNVAGTSFGGFDASGDLTINTSTGIVTLATVNSNIGTFVATTLNAKGLVTAGTSLNGDCASSGATITCTKSNGTLFAASATTDTTNAGNITSGTLPAARLPNSGVSAGSYTNTNLTVDATGRITTASNGATTAVTWPANGTIVISNTTNSPGGITPSGDWTINTTTGVATLNTSVNTNIGKFSAITINNKGLATAGSEISGDCATVAGVITCTKTNGASFVASATTDATNANNITSGTLPAARLPNTAVVAGSYTNVNATVDSTGRITAMSNGATAGVTWPANGTIVISNTTNTPGGITPSGDWTINTMTGVDTLASVNSNVGRFESVTVNVKGLVTSATTLSGDCTTSNGVITCTKTSGTVFAASATTDTTNASNITSGTLSAARLPTTAVTAGSYTNTNLTVDSTGRITAASNGATAGVTWPANGTIVVSNTTNSPGGITPSGDWTINTTTGVATLATVNSNIGTFIATTINAKGLVTSAANVTGDCTSSSGVITCTKTNGTAFATSATTDTTNASNITSGTLPAARLPTSGVTAASYTLMNATVDATGRVTAASNGTPTGAVFMGNTTGSANAYTISSTVPAGFTLNDNYIVCGAISAVNSGASTLTVSPAAAIAINRQNVGGLTALVGGELRANGQKYCFQYSSTAGVWIVQNNIFNSVLNNQATANITQTMWTSQRLLVVTATNQTLTLPTSTSLDPNGWVTINAIASFVLSPTAASGNTIQSPAGIGAANASLTINAGTVATITTDAAGHFYVNNDPAGAPSYPTGFNTIDATQQPIGDICNKISTASTALQALNPLGGKIDASGGTNGTFPCAASMFTGWPSPPFYGTVVLGAGWADTRVYQPIPKNAQVITPWLPVPLTSNNQTILSVSGATPSGVPINPIQPSYTMAIGGSGTTCSLASPCGTFAQLQSNLEGSSTVKLGFIRGGTYNAASFTLVACGGLGNTFLCLTAGDDNITFSYFPPDGIGSAILNGQGSLAHPSTAADNIIFMNSTGVNISVIGLQMENPNEVCLQMYPVSGWVAQYNICHDAFMNVGTGLSGIGVYGGGHGTKILNNVIYNTTDNSIGVHTNTSGETQVDTSFLMSGNFAYNSCTGTGDCGQLYYQDPNALNGGVYGRGCFIINNYIRDDAAGGNGRGIYLDDGASNCVVSGNVITGANGYCFQIHGGSNNLITGNVCDVGATTNHIIYYQLSVGGNQMMVNNVFKNNLILSNNTTTAAAGYDGDGTASNPLHVHDNLYYGYNSHPVVPSTCSHTAECNGDSNPFTLVAAPPNLYCYSAIMANDQMQAAPFNFPVLVGNWGYPGYIVDTSGTAPSWPHSGLPCTSNVP